uniref:Uncharacterized protein n=1 Tax=Periophthalmus magnuspinnatus TaxID=409849 RepID=A0A3B3ZBX2_9GOBI
MFKASALCRYLERHHTELNLVDKAVLEIGSGTGLVLKDLFKRGNCDCIQKRFIYTGEQKNVKPFNWAPSVISCLGKEVYHYVGTDIKIFEAFDTYGGVMWPGAVALCSFLEHNRDMVNLEDKTVMELGAGTGLVAIVASLLGAKVTATDLPEILGNLRSNVMRNTRGRCKYLPQICALPWSFDVERTFPSALYRFDYVLAADVVYHHDFLDELLATMAHFCRPRTTTIIWANKVRLESDLKFTEKFKEEFNTKLLAEDGDMKIFMAKFKM